MTRFANAQHQAPEIWIAAQSGPVTLQQIIRRYNISEETATNMLEAMVRNRRIFKVRVGDETRWDVRRRASSSS